MTVRSKTELTTNINNDLADNNAGLISAADIRNNMLDIVDSINQVVASGNFDATTPFSPNDVRAKINTSLNTGGMFIAESGLYFPNRTDTNSGYQYEPYPGPENIDHNTLSNLTVGNPHTQYMSVNGLNKAVANMPFGTEWINSSGALVGAPNTDNRGLRFEYTDTSVSGEIIHVGSNSTLKFDVDGSHAITGKGFAQAWISFVGTSGNISINSSYNISGVQHIDNGQYKVYFNPLTFSDGNYVAIGNSNGRDGSGSAEDFEINTVGLVDRTKDYVTFYVIDDDNDYVNGAVNDLVIFGNLSGVQADTTPSITNLPT